MEKYRKLIGPIEDIELPSKYNTSRSTGIDPKPEREDEVLDDVASLKTFSEAKISSPVFQLFPSKIFFKDFEPHETYKASLVLRNNDMVPRQVKVIQNTVSPYFELITPRAAGHNVAPGLTKTYKIQFTPNEKKDYFHELVCITERETFIVPIKAIGPRALLDFPDEIHFPVCTVKHSNTKTLLIQNIGNRDAIFSLTVERPFSVTPERGSLAIDDRMQVTFSFTPETTNDIKTDLVLHYDTGEDVFITLYGAAQDSNVRLDKNTIRFENTYITTSTQRTVTIQNRSNVIAYFRWTQFATQEEEEQQKVFQQFELDKVEKKETESFLDECDNNPILRDKLSILGRTFKTMQKIVSNNKLLFTDDVVTLEPLEGEIWPNSSSDVTIVFNPKEAQLYTRTAFCDITGRESRLPLCIRGCGQGPVVESSFQDLSMGNIFIGSVHVYEVVLKNKGDLDAIFTVMQKVSLFGPCFNFSPNQGIIEPGGCQGIQITFQSAHLGDFSEEFFFHIDGSLDPLLITFTGSVVGPTFQFNVTKLMFGTVSYGFLNTRTCTLLNTSLVPMTFHLRIPSDGVVNSVCSMSDLNDYENGNIVGPVKEFEIIPATETLPPMSKTKITVKFISNTPKKYDVALVVDVDNVGEEVLSLKISARCIVPSINLINSDINYGRCFLRYPYERAIELENNTDLSAKYELVPQNKLGVENPPLHYYSPTPKGIIPPRTVCVMPLFIEAQALDIRHMSVYINIFGAPGHDLEVKITFLGEGPVVCFEPKEIDWGVVPVLKDVPRIIVFSNESRIPARFTATIMRPNSVFRVEPSEGEIGAEDSLDVSVIAHLDDCLGFENEVEINIIESYNHTVSLKAFGQGTTIFSDPPLTSKLDLGHHFSNRPIRKVFKLINKGRRQQYLLWTTDGFHINKDKRKIAAYNSQDIKNKNVPPPPKPTLPIFKLTPNRMNLLQGETVELVLEGWVDTPQVIHERLLCHGIIGKQEGKELIMKIDVTANCICPLMEFSTKCVYFRVDVYGGQYTEFVIKELVMCNMTYLPLTTTLKLGQPFQIILDDGTLASQLEISLDVGHSYTMKIQFNHMFEGEFNIQTIDAVLVVTYKEHPHVDYIALRGEVYFPNVELEKSVVNFGCILNDTEVTRYVNMTNTSPMEVKYKWTFVIGDQPCVKVNREPVIKDPPPAEVTPEKKQVGLSMDQLMEQFEKSDSQFAYIDDCYLALEPDKSDENVDKELPQEDFEEITIPFIHSIHKIPDAPELHIQTILPRRLSMMTTPPLPDELLKTPLLHVDGVTTPQEEDKTTTALEQQDKVMTTPVEDPPQNKGVVTPTENEKDLMGVKPENQKEVTASEVPAEDQEPELSILTYNAADAALKSNQVLSALLQRDRELTTPVGIEQVFDILPLFGILEPDQNEQITLTFFGHADISAEVKAVCEIEGGPIHELSLKGEASSVEYNFDTRDIDFGHQLYDQVISSELTLYNTGKVGFHFITINTDPLLAKNPPPGVPIMVPPSGFIEPQSEQKLTLKFIFGVPEKFHKIFLIQVAHFEPDIINLYGDGWFPRISLDLPRLIDEAGNFAALEKKAEEALMLEAELKEELNRKLSTKASPTKDLQGDESPAKDLLAEESESAESLNKATQTDKSHIQADESLNKETQTEELLPLESLTLEEIMESHPKEQQKKKLHSKESHTKETHDKETHPKESHAKETHAKEPNAKKSHAKESHTKESPGKESHAKESHGKESHGKESHTKKSHTKESPTDESKKSVNTATQTIITLLTEKSHGKKSSSKELRGKKSHNKKSTTEESPTKETETKETHQKKSVGEESHTKESETKEPNTKEHAKKTQGKELQAKESHPKKSPGKESHDRKSLTKDSLIDEPHTKESEAKDSDKESHRKKTHGKKSLTKDLLTEEPHTKESQAKKLTEELHDKKSHKRVSPTEDPDIIELEAKESLNKETQTSESDFKVSASKDSLNKEALGNDMANVTDKERRPSAALENALDKKIQPPMPSDIDIQMEAERLAVVEIELALQQEAMYLDSDNMPTDRSETVELQKAPLEPKKSKKKPKARICLPEYILDFGHVILGTVRTQVIHATNNGTYAVSFQVETKNLNKFGFDVHLDRVRNLPGAPDHETVEFLINFDPRGANLPLGPVRKCLQISVVNGPTVCIVLKANVTMPNMQLSDDELNFEEVRCGECKIITVQLHNNHLISCEWSAEKHCKPVSKRVPMFLKRGIQPEKKRLPIFDVIPQDGTLLAGEKTNIQVKFTPTEEKVYEQKIPFRIAQSSERLVLLCSGNGIEPQLVFEQTHVEFDPILPNTTSDEKEIIVRNPCNFPIEFYSLEFDQSYLEEEKVLRMVNGYDKNNTILLPVRDPGDKLPVELLDYYEEQIKKFAADSDETGSTTADGHTSPTDKKGKHAKNHNCSETCEKHHGHPGNAKHHGTDGGGKHHGTDGGGKHHGTDGNPKHHGSDGSAKHHGSDGSPRHHGTDGGGKHHGTEVSPRHHGADGSGKHHEGAGKHNSDKTDKHHSSDKDVKHHSTEGDTSDKDVVIACCDGVGELDITPVSAAIARHLGLDLTPEVKAARSRRGIAIFIHGPRKSGKTEMAEKLAKKYNAAILTVDRVVLQSIAKGESPAAKRVWESYLEFAFKSDEERKRLIEIEEQELAGGKQSGPGHQKGKGHGRRSSSGMQGRKGSSVGHTRGANAKLSDKMKDKLHTPPEGNVQHILQLSGTPPSLMTLVNTRIRAWTMPEDDLVDILTERIELDDCYWGIVFDGLESIFTSNVLATANAILKTFKGRRFIFFVPLEEDSEILKERAKNDIKEKQRRSYIAQDEERMRLEQMDEVVYDALTEEEREQTDKRLLELKKLKVRRDHLEKIEREKREEARRKREEAELEALREKERENDMKHRRSNKKFRQRQPVQRVETLHSSIDQSEKTHGEVSFDHSELVLDDNKKKRGLKDGKVIKPKEIEVILEEPPEEAAKEIEQQLVKQFQTYESVQSELYYLLEHWDRMTMQIQHSPCSSGDSQKKKEFEETNKEKEKEQKKSEKYTKEVMESFGIDLPIPPPAEFTVVTYPEPRKLPARPVYGGRYLLASASQEELSLGLDEKVKDDEEDKTDTLDKPDHIPQIKLKGRKRSPRVPSKGTSPPPSDTTTETHHVDGQRNVSTDDKPKEENGEEEIMEASPSKLKGKLQHKPAVKKTKKLGVRGTTRNKSPQQGQLTKQIPTVNELSIEDGSGGTDGKATSPSVFRWIVPANGEVTLRMRFLSEELGMYVQTFNFEIVSTKQQYQLYCRGKCAYPTVSLDPNIVFPHVKKNKKDDEIVHKKFIIATKTFEFGPLLACKSREKYREGNFPENVENLTILNASPLQADVNIGFQLDNYGDTFLFEPEQMVLAPGQTGTITVWAYPKCPGRFVDVLIIAVKSNPDPTHFNIACDGCKPTLELDKKAFLFEKVLLHRKETRTIVMKNKTLLPVAWRLDGMEFLGDDFTVGAYSGVVEPMSEYSLNAYFRALKTVGVTKKNIKLQVYDVDNVMGVMETELIQVNAEAYDVSLDVHFTKGSNCCFDFGTIRVFEEVKQSCTLKNKGKYPISFNFVCEDVDPHHTGVAKFFTIVPQKGTMSPADRPLALNVTFKADREVSVKEQAIIKCQVIDPAVGESGETIANIPVKVSVTTAFSKFIMMPTKEINFGSQVASSKKTRQLMIENKGEFEFRYTVVKKIEEVPQKLSNIKLGVDKHEDNLSPAAIAEKLKQAELLRQYKMDRLKPQEDILLGSVNLGDRLQPPDFSAGLQVPGALDAANMSQLNFGQGLSNRLSVIRTDTVSSSFRLIHGVFTIFPASGMVLPNNQNAITIECSPESQLGHFKEEIFVDISDRDPQDNPGGFPFSLIAESWIPSINVNDVGSIFEEHRICKSLGLWQHLNELQSEGIYGEDERRFVFNNVIVGRKAKARFKISNVSKVTCEVVFTIKSASIKEAAIIQEIFEVEPARGMIPIHSQIYVTVTFTPPSMQRYLAYFEAAIEGVTYSHGRGRSLTFELLGEGNLPRISVDKPTVRNKRGQPLFLFKRILLGRSQTLPLTLLNDGTLPSKVFIEMVDPGGIFKLESTGETTSRKPEINSDGKAVAKTPYPTSVVVHVGESITFNVIFSPIASERYEAYIKMMVIDNMYENVHIQLVGEGYEDDITLDNIHSIINRVAPDTEDGCPEEEEIQAAKPNLINFGDCYINEPKVLTFSLTNHSQADNMKFQWPDDEHLKFSPHVGHIRPGSTKDFSITFKCDSPNALAEQQVLCSVSKIFYENVADEANEWDDKIRTVKWIDIPLPPSPVPVTSSKGGKASRELPVSPASALPASIAPSPRGLEPPFKKKVVETEPEPPHTVLASSTRNIELLVSGVANYCQYNCKVEKIHFKDTLMFMTRVYKMKLKNTGEIQMDYKWMIIMTNQMASSTDENSMLIDSSYVPFTIEPDYGNIEAGKTVILTVKFSPLDVNEYEAILTCSIPNLENEDKGPVITIKAHSLMPYCHFDLEESGNIYPIQQASGTAISGALSRANHDPNLRVIHFSCLGILVTSKREFDMLNPTKQSYRFEWICVDEPDPKKPFSFRCVYPVGEIQSNKKFKAVFEFYPTCVDTMHSYWTFVIPEKNISVKFLLVGIVIEPDIMIDRSHLTFNALIGRETMETVYIMNNENIPYKFTFEEHSCHADGYSSPIDVEPMCGTLAPKSKFAVNLRFRPNSDKKLNFNLLCNVKTKPRPMTLNVKAEGYAVSSTVYYEHFSGERVELSEFDLSMIDFGETEIRETVTRNIHISNTGKFNFDFKWELPEKLVKNDVVTIDPKEGRVNLGKKITCKLVFCPPSALCLKCEAFLKIQNGPSYNMRVLGYGVAPSLHFSFLSYKFGNCFIHQAGMSINSVTLEITNKDKKDISLDCLYESTQQLHHTFKPGIIKPNDSLEAVFIFYPREAKKYHETVIFEINGLTKQKIEFFGQGTELKIEVVDIKHKMIIIGPRVIGDEVKKVIPIVNKSLAPLTFKVDVTRTLKALHSTTVLSILPSGNITLKPKGTTSLEVYFRPKSRVTQFIEEVFMEFAGVYLPLCVIKGSCLGMEVSLSTAAIVFGAIVQLGRSTRKLVMYNTGDMNAKFRWDIKSFAPDFSIHPVEGYITAGKEVIFDVTFHPQDVKSEIKYTDLLCFLKGGQHRPLSLTLYGICTSVIPVKDIQNFTANVRQKDVKSVSVQNRTNQLWELKPVIDGEQWSGNTSLIVEPQQTKQYQLMYRPLCMTKENKKDQGSVFFAMPDGTGLLYYLCGTADPPKVSDKIQRDVPCKMTYTEMLPVKNWLKKPQRFRVKTELGKSDKAEPGVVLKGMDFIDVPASSKKEYRLTFFSFKEGNVTVKVRFTNEITGEYQHFEILFRATKPDVVSTIELTTACRQSCPYTINLFNPMTHMVTFSVTCSVPEVLLPSNVVVPGETESRTTFEYQPLKVGVVKGRLEFSCTDLGLYMYDLVLKATPSGPERPLYFRIPLGQNTTQVAKFVNYAKQRAEFTCRTSCPDFTVAKGIAVAGYGIEATLDVIFEPSKLGEQHGKLLVHSTAAGDYTFPLYGSCLPPKPQGPFTVKMGLTQGIIFRNIFSSLTQFTFQVDNPLFSVTKMGDSIRPRKDYKIGVTFSGNDSGSRAPVTGQLIVSCARSAGCKRNVQWVFYLKGITPLL